MSDVVLPFDTLKRITRYWPSSESCQRIEPVTTGATNQIYRLSEPETFYLRRFKTGEPQKIIREHALVANLSEQALPVVLPLCTMDNRTWVEEMGSFFALYPEARGEIVNQLSLSHARAAGEALARLHLGLVGYRQDGFPVIPLRWSQSSWVARLQVIIDRLQSQANPTDTERWALIRAKQQQQFLASDCSIHHYQPVSKPQLIHGDYHQYNVFFDANREVSAVIDWDLVCCMPVGYEIARACMYMFQLDAGHCAEFVRGYIKWSPLTNETLDDGAKAWGIYADHHVWALEAVYLHGNTAAKKFIPHREFVPFMQRWRAMLEHTGLRNDVANHV
ncbi:MULTISPECIES: phosphotransferase [unclassified Vibrio]|uniref:phosphotransferase n=1 Tax=unclassified Vibrio TaxID=2614977 RepID=UPI001361253E|nr:phosphotransferase [Vibrio sp. V36_P2S2PM302]NAX26317.1 phosphotransferase [Vibrio sp. V38_P2S17PM301]NAX31353.1 phosphotransferase [Vibrio sp. V37_P2S8PM304]